jgi:hypothetical protein
VISNTTLQRSLLTLAALNLAVVVWDIVTGGIYFTIFGVVFSSWEIGKPLRYAAGCAATAVWLRDRAAVRASWDIRWPWAARAAIAVALASSGVAIWFGVRAAGGADAYGYVSEAAQWLRHSLVADDPLAAVTPQLGAAVAPAGYTLAPGGGGLVGVYPPGLPLTMAFAQWLGGSQAVFLVVPLFAGMAVWFTYVAGARAASDRVGLLAAIVLACSPLFFLQSFEPMSDVPAVAWWTAAWAISMSSGSWSAFGAGVATAAAILTRPNLAPLAPIVAASAALSAPRLRRVAAFAAPVAAGCLLVAAFNAALYGSPMLSGYGPVGALFSWANGAANIRAYTRWMNDLYSPAILLALAAPWVCRRVVWLMLAFSAGVALSYLFYVPFGDWPFARFLLPAIPLMLVMTSAVAVAGIERLPPALRSSAAIVCAALLAARGVDVANRLHVFDVAAAEQRYATIGEYVGRTLPPNAVVVASIHSGSVRRYGKRLTLRWDALPPDGLDRAIAVLRDRGYAPYLLLEDWEEPLYRDHFGRANTFGALDWPPAMEYPWSGHARVYAIDDRERHLAGTPVVTAPIPTSD